METQTPHVKFQQMESQWEVIGKADEVTAADLH